MLARRKAYSLVYANAWMTWHYFIGFFKIKTATQHNQAIT